MTIIKVLSKWLLTWFIRLALLFPLLLLKQLSFIADFADFISDLAECYYDKIEMWLESL